MCEASSGCAQHCLHCSHSSSRTASAIRCNPDCSSRPTPGPEHAHPSSFVLLYMLLLPVLLLLLQIMVLDKDRELRWKDYRRGIFSQFFRCASKLGHSSIREQDVLLRATDVQQSSSVPLWNMHAACSCFSAAWPCSCTQLLCLCMPAPAGAAAPCRVQIDGCTKQQPTNR
jgi:hypothetical protein